MVVNGTTISRDGFDLHGNAIAGPVFAAQPNATAGGFAAATTALGGLSGPPAQPAGGSATSPPKAIPGGTLTGEWLEFEVSRPGAPKKTFVREILDRIGVKRRSAPGAKTIKSEYLSAQNVAAPLLSQRSILVQPRILNKSFALNTLVTSVCRRRDLLHATFAEKVATIETPPPTLPSSTAPSRAISPQSLSA